MPDAPFWGADFYSHIPCGMWHHSYISYLSIQSISTHTSRVGCDFSAPSSTPTITYFYSHIPCGMWLWKGGRNFVKHDFYSHIPCGMWLALPNLHNLLLHFYSHIPCGMWHCPWNMVAARRKFLLTHPVWDVTSVNAEIYRSKNFYSHIPCGMWRYMGLMYPSFLFHFYSHIPCGMWRELGYMSIITTYISTHTSRVGCDAIPYASSKVFCYFYSHIPCGMWQQSAYCADVW